jgi:XrtJ-associated TM-motif-TM protein
MKKVSAVAVLACLVVLSAPAFAQGGCVNSPENPTAILAIAGSAGAFFAAMRGRLRRRK